MPGWWPRAPSDGVRGVSLRRRPRCSGILGLGLAGAVLSACSSMLPVEARPATPPGRFEIGRDTFAFANLVRAQRPGLNDDFANYCIVMARAAGQFHRFARFAPDEAPRTAAEYTRLVREVLAIPAWTPPQPPEARVVIPGYPSLFALSAAQEPAIKAAFGSNVLSMMHWRTWRVSLALSAAHQRRVADELRRETDAGRPAPLMITNFPDEDLLNHAVLVYAHRPHARAIEFLAYDPNDPGSPMSLYFDPADEAFWVAPLPYSPPGRIRAFRLYASPLL